MAAYAQYGCGYPSANQYLTTGTVTTLPTHHPISQSPLATTPSQAPSISPPSHGHDSNVSGDNHSGTLTPDPASQTSIATMGTASVATGTSSTDSGNSYSCAVPTNGAVGTLPTLCCDNGRPMMTDPISGQAVCSCQYDPTRLALSSYARMQAAPGVGVGVSVYGTPYASNEQNPYPSIGVDGGTFYSSLSNPYALKEGGGGAGSEVPGWSSAGLQPTTGYYTYDPTFGAYGYGASYDLAARRKNATRESTATLKAWLSEHKKNPYPTKGEKIMLAIITKMTLTQVSTWFANARRRLKKENKMTWEPKNRTEDDDDALASDDDRERDDGAVERRRHGDHGATANNSQHKNNGTAGADVAAAASAATTTPAVGVVAGAAVGPGPSPGAGVGVGGCVVGIVQPKDSYQPTHGQYARNLYYSNGNAPQHFQALHLPTHRQQHQHQQQQQPPAQRLPAAQTQSAIAALSQHVAESTVWQHQQHQQQQQQRQPH